MADTATNTPVIDRIEAIARNVLKRDTVPLPNSEAPAVAEKITEAVKADPLVKDATNTEPWYKSRIYIGLAVSAVGLVGGAVGVTVTADDIAKLFENINAVVLGITAIITIAGQAYALYGRIVGASKQPLGEGNKV